MKMSEGSNLSIGGVVGDVLRKYVVYSAVASRKYLGFRIFSKLLRNATASETAKLFASPNFIKCLISNCAKPKLFTACTDCLKAIARCAKHPETSAKKRVAIVAALRQVGLHRFEKKLAKSSGISTLMAALTREEAKKCVCEELRETILKKSDVATTTKDDDDDDDDTDNNDDGKRKKNSRDFKRLWALEQTCSIMWKALCITIARTY